MAYVFVFMKLNKKCKITKLISKNKFLFLVIKAGTEVATRQKKYMREIE